MATAFDTASQMLHSTIEKENYMRISRLVIVGGTNLMREVLDFFYPPSSLPNKLTDPATKNKLLRTLIKPELEKVYPPTGGCGESKDFDITLLSKLMKTISPLAPPVTGWADLPDPTDASLVANIVRIKVYRNAICHQYHNMEISDDDFPTLWSKVKKALISIAGFLNRDTERKWKKEIDKLFNAPLTPEAELNARELYEWYLKDMDAKECIEQGFRNVHVEQEASSQRLEEGIARVERKIQGVQASFEEGSQKIEERVHQLERDVQDLKAGTVQRIDEGFEHLESEIQGVQVGRERADERVSQLENQVIQLRQLVMMQRDSSSGGSGACLPVRIEPESITELSPEDSASAMLAAFESQPNASGGNPSGVVTKGDNSVYQCLPNEQQVMNIITLRVFQHLDPSSSEQRNEFLDYIEKVKRALIVDFDKGSIVLTVKCNSLEILEGLWEDYCTGRLGELAQKFLVTEDILEQLGLTEVKLRAIILKEDYLACQKYLTKISAAEEKRENEKDKADEEKDEMGKDEEIVVEGEKTEGLTSEPTKGVTSRVSNLPRPIRHFVNRSRELQEIKKDLGSDPQNDCRCVLVHGAVGMGKTTTAIKAANEILDANPDTVVVHVNCRYVTSLEDLAGKIGNQLHGHFPFNEPISEIKMRLINEEEHYTILFLDNFEFLLHLGNSDNGEKKPERPNEESDITNFITEIVTKSRKVRLLVTSSENVGFPGTFEERIRLLPFNEDDSFKLLKKVYGDTPIEKETAHKIAQFCGGIPLVLCTLASWKDHPSVLVEMLTNSDPKQAFDLFTRIPGAAEDKKINVCLDACFNRLDAQMQETLVSLALFRGLFTIPRAVEVFLSAELRITIPELARRSFLEQNFLDPASPCQYSLLTVISLYCQNKALDLRFRKVVWDARNMFIDYYLTFLKDTFKAFLSTDVSKAIIAFRQEDENILQIIDWFGENGAMVGDQEQRCIDLFNDVGELLAKMTGKKKFDTVFTMLRKKCEDMEDQKRLSECLTTLGINEIFRCCCSPGLCNEAAGRAKTYLMEADRIQSSLGINDGNSRAQCLAKVGRCLVKEHNFTEGKQKIQQAIEIRKAHGNEDIVMLGATYNDLAVALSLAQEHQQAIEIREQQTLPIYREKLGNHPFTATILNNLSNNYYALGEYDNAKQYSEEALKIRRELLKNHYDTAKSLFDLGMVHKKKEEFKEAKQYLEDCASMQKVLQDDNIMDLERTQDELEDVIRILAIKMEVTVEVVSVAEPTEADSSTEKKTST